MAGQIFTPVVSVMRAPETSSVLRINAGFVDKSRNCFSGTACLYSSKNFDALGHKYVPRAFSTSSSLAVMKISGPTFSSASGGLNRIPQSSWKLKRTDHSTTFGSSMILHKRIRLVGSPKLAGESLTQNWEKHHNEKGHNQNSQRRAELSGSLLIFQLLPPSRHPDWKKSF